MKSLKPEIIIGNTSRRTSELEEGPQGTAGKATTTAQAFISSQAHLLMLESTPYFLKCATRTYDFSPLLSTSGFCWRAVEILAQQVRVPSTKRRTFVPCVQNHPSTEERLIRLKSRLIDMRVQPVTLDDFIGREGSYFVNRKQGEQKIFSFEDYPTLSMTRDHILGEKPPLGGYQPHPPDASSLEDAQEFNIADFIKIATGFEGYIFPLTLAGAPLPPSSSTTPGGMMRAVVTCLLAMGVLPKAPTIPPDWEQEGLSCKAFDNIRNTDGGIDETLIQEELQNPTTESNVTLIIAPMVTRKEKQRMLQSDHPPTPQASRRPSLTAPPGEMPPPPTPVASPSRTRTRKQKDQTHQTISFNYVTSSAIWVKLFSTSA